LIEIKNISKAFDGRQIVQDVSFTFHKGKTNIVYDGQNFPKLSTKGQQEIRKQIGMTFQGGALFDSQTLEENVMFPLDMFTDMSRQEKMERVNFCLDRVQLTGKNKLYPAELSGGMKKRAALARAIANKPRYLFCDEPNSGLDPKTAIVIDKLIHSITQEFDITTIIITHDMNSVIEIGENIMFVHKGQNWWTGDKTQILNTNNKELFDFVFASEYMKNLFLAGKK
jgi:phospholipid/cholesterol/gamma-HCH transport system ATP-binding protein